MLKPQEWQSILSQGSKSDSPQRRLARLLLVQMPQLDQATALRRMKGIRDSDPIQGNLALHWMLSALSRRAVGRDKHFLLSQADVAMEEAVLRRKLRKGWSQYGVCDPWLVVYPEQVKWLPR